MLDSFHEGKMVDKAIKIANHRILLLLESYRWSGQ